MPQIPSVRIVDLATAMAPTIPRKIVGIRAGEKIHEVMCPTDDSHLTLQFQDHFVIRPTIAFTERGNSYSPNRLGEEGVPVEQGFEYNSGTNKHFLSIPEIVEFDKLAHAQ